eukprot:gene15147-17919_t
MANIGILEYWTWPYEIDTFAALQAQQAAWEPEDQDPRRVNFRLWQRLRQQVQENWEDFGHNRINFNTWNRWGIPPLFVHGHVSTAPLGVRHLAYWYEGGWIYHRYDEWDIQDWIDRNRYSETTHGALMELESDLLRDDEGRCEQCGRMFRICTLARTYDASACPDP